MKFIRFLLPLVVALGLTTTTHAYDGDGFHRVNRFDDELSERDWEALKDYINTKRTINIQEKACNLTIAGDVRVDWRNICEKQNGRKVIPRKADKDCLEHGLTCKDGSCGKKKCRYKDEKLCKRQSHAFIDVEFNLYFDYVCDRAWAVSHVQFDNSAGVDDNGKSFKNDPEGFHGSGKCSDLCLKKAYFGYNICCCGDTRFDVEVGRRNMYSIFDSKVQFLSRFDGIVFKYYNTWDCMADWYVYLGGFAVDTRANHYSWITEVGFLNICDTCLDLKYSFVDWRHNGENVYGCHDPIGFKYLNSQFTFAYHMDQEILCAPATFYGAFIWNHDAPTKITNCKYKGKNGTTEADDNGEHNKYIKLRHKNNIAWYLGFSLGEVYCEGDWALDVRYEVVEFNAIPDNDVSGIGRGNRLKQSKTATGHGNTNYRGWVIDTLYAVTDNLTIDTSFEYSTQDRKNLAKEIQGKQKELKDKHEYSRFRLEGIYAF